MIGSIGDTQSTSRSLGSVGPSAEKSHDNFRLRWHSTLPSNRSLHTANATAATHSYDVDEKLHTLNLVHLQLHSRSGELELIYGYLKDHKFIIRHGDWDTLVF